MFNKICLIVCYFGNFPDIFGVWVQSCKKNPEFDFLIFTDQVDIDNQDGNIKYIKCSLSDIEKLAKKKLNYESVRICSAYKLCDFKPMYGVIFSDYLHQYDFWGMCDVDMIFGSLNTFINDDILLKYDKIYQLGHLTLYRNTLEVNERYKLDGYLDWKKVVLTPNHCRLCERGMMEKYSLANIPVYDKHDYADISKIHKRYQLSKWLVPKEEQDRNKNQIFYYENGHIYRAIYADGEIRTQEFNYIHLQKRNIIVNDDIEDSFYISRDQLIPKKRAVSKEDILALNPYHGALYEIFECILYEAKNRNILNRIITEYKEKINK